MIAARRRRQSPPRQCRALCTAIEHLGPSGQRLEQSRIPFDMAPTSAYAAAAPTFERHRGLPAGTAEAIRAAILGAIATPSPRLLDLGAGTGRIGRAFVEAGDDYVGVD